MSIAEMVTVGSQLVIAVAAAGLFFELRGIRTLLTRRLRGSVTSHGPGMARLRSLAAGREPPSFPSSHRVPARMAVNWKRTGYTVWAYRSGVWTVVESLCPEGYGVGLPPDRPGRFENEHVRTPGVRSTPE